MDSSTEIYDLSGYRRAYDPKKPKSVQGPITPPETPKSNIISPSADSAIAFDVTTPQKPSSIPSPYSETSAQSPAQSVSVEVAEQMYDIIEDIVERQMSEALGPFLLNTRTFAGQNLDFHRQVQKQNSLFDSQALTLGTTMTAQAEGLATIAKITNQLAAITNPLDSRKFRENISATIRQEVQAALNECIQNAHGFAMHPSAFAVQGLETQQSQASDLETSCTCGSKIKSGRILSAFKRIFRKK